MTQTTETSTNHNTNVGRKLRTHKENNRLARKCVSLRRQGLSDQAIAERLDIRDNRGGYSRAQVSYLISSRRRMKKGLKVHAEQGKVVPRKYKSTYPWRTTRKARVVTETPPLPPAATTATSELVALIDLIATTAPLSEQTRLDVIRRLVAGN